MQNAMFGEHQTMFRFILFFFIPSANSSKLTQAAKHHMLPVFGRKPTGLLWKGSQARAALDGPGGNNILIKKSYNDRLSM